MDINVDFHAVYPHHDLLIELGEVEIALDGLDEHDHRSSHERRPDLESRMQRLSDALDHLAV